MNKILFQTNLTYYDRESKQKWVADKYSEILTGRILDVGADEGYIEKHLIDAEYYCIGLGGKNPKVINLDLEKENIPFEDNYFDCAMCLDVLEHLENVHACFDELCRVSNEWLIVSLPNPYNDLLNYFRSGKYMNREKNMKFYGLPKERESDRHKWFFSALEAADFISYRAEKNGFAVYDFFTVEDNSIAEVLNIKACCPDFDLKEICFGTLWWVLKKTQ